MKEEKKEMRNYLENKMGENEKKYHENKKQEYEEKEKLSGE